MKAEPHSPDVVFISEETFASAVLVQWWGERQMTVD